MPTRTTYRIIVPVRYWYCTLHLFYRDLEKKKIEMQYLFQVLNEKTTTNKVVKDKKTIKPIPVSYRRWMDTYDKTLYRYDRTNRTTPLTVHGPLLWTVRPWTVIHTSVRIREILNHGTRNGKCMCMLLRIPPSSEVINYTKQ